MEWCTIESDPGVFTELIEKIGVQGVSVEEVYSLDDRASLDQFDQIYGFIFLFRITKNVEKRMCLADWDPSLFFAQQVVQNACGTQAILSVIMNNSDIELGQEMANFKDFSMNLDPQTRGIAIGQSDLIRTQHNAFARPDNFVVQEKVTAKEGDAVFHFVSYIPFKNQVFELDGCQSGPILLGEVSGDKDWIETAKLEINKRIEKYTNNEIRFNLLAVVKSKAVNAKKALRKHKVERGVYLQALSELQGGSFDQSKYPDFLECMHLKPLENEMAVELSANERNEENLIKKLDDLQTQISIQLEIIQGEEFKASEYRIENDRRKHNYIPFILELLKISSQRGELEGLYEKAKTAVAGQTAN